MNWAKQSIASIIPIKDLDMIEKVAGIAGTAAYAEGEIYHYQDVDKQFSNLNAKKVEDKDLLNDIAMGVDYSSLTYDFESLCNNLDSSTELIVLSKETKLSLVPSMISSDPDQPDGMFIIIN